MSAVVIADRVRIPAWVVDLESFRRWARSDEFPDQGRFSYLRGEVWVDLSMEQLFSHNQVKTEYTVVVGGLVKSAHLGYFFSDRPSLSNPAADLSTEPDGLFVSWQTLRSGRVRLVQGAEEGFVELEGTPDMALEIVSPNSVRKDTVVLRELYWRAGVAEFWLVDARGQAPRFEILRHTPEGFVSTEAVDGFLPSAVFGKAFQLTQEADALGHPQFTLFVRP
ncbi:MAG TPA: Uma2 family endonuclease [Gemmataceae bacterium]|jgi:Uma2 family endonuclease|nr:Uma2 family endonuclease [Gemmataceae bacterium]